MLIKILEFYLYFHKNKIILNLVNLDSCFYVFTCVGAEFLYFFLISCIFNCAIYICNCCEVRDFGAIGCT